MNMTTAINLCTDQTVTQAAEIKAGLVAVDISAATTNDMCLQATVTNGTAAKTGSNRVTIFYAFAMTDESATPGKLAPVGRFEVHIPNAANAIVIATTDKITIRAKYIHVWFDHEYLLNGSAKFTLDAIV